MPVERTGWFICHRPGNTEPMVGELMTLPVRAGVRVTRFALNTTLTLSARALTLAGGALQSFTDRHEHEQHVPAESPPPASRPAASPSRAPTQTPPKRAPSTPGVAPQSPPPPEADTSREPVDEAPEPVDETPEPVDETPEPAHVSEEPELVAEVSEPGAEDGAGATVTVDEPWDGYTRLNAQDVIDRLADAGTAELAAIQLYESTHKRRETVLTAVARELRQAGARPDRH